MIWKSLKHYSKDLRTNSLKLTAKPLRVEKILSESQSGASVTRVGPQRLVKARSWASEVRRKPWRP